MHLTYITKIILLVIFIILLNVVLSHVFHVKDYIVVSISIAIGLLAARYEDKLK